MSKCLGNIKIQMGLKKTALSYLPLWSQKHLQYHARFRDGLIQLTKGHHHIFIYTACYCILLIGKKEKGREEVHAHRYIGGTKVQLMSFKCPLH